jgi:hypothetical protein
VPQQALFALNSEFVQNRARALAMLTGKTAGQDDQLRVRELYRRVLAREPRPAELDRLLRFVRTGDEASRAEAWQQAAHSLLASNEFSFVD